MDTPVWATPETIRTIAGHEIDKILFESFRTFQKDPKLENFGSLEMAKAFTRLTFWRLIQTRSNWASVLDEEREALKEAVIRSLII